MPDGLGGGKSFWLSLFLGIESDCSLDAEMVSLMLLAPFCPTLLSLLSLPFFDWSQAENMPAPARHIMAMFFLILFIN